MARLVLKMSIGLQYALSARLSSDGPRVSAVVCKFPIKYSIHLQPKNAVSFSLSFIGQEGGGQVKCQIFICSCSLLFQVRMGRRYSLGCIFRKH